MKRTVYIETTIPMSKDDPVVQRVRQTRRKIADRHGQDTCSLYEWAKGIEQAHRDRLVGYEPAKRTDRRPKDLG